MKVMEEEKVYPCSTSLAMRFIGGKWKSVILIHLVAQELRYNELRKLMPAITERALSLQLKQLEEDGLLERVVYVQKAPLRVGYRLTDFGKTLAPILKGISDWGKYVANSKGYVFVCENTCEIAKGN